MATSDRSGCRLARPAAASGDSRTRRAGCNVRIGTYSRHVGNIRPDAAIRTIRSRSGHGPFDEELPMSQLDKYREAMRQIAGIANGLAGSCSGHERPAGSHDPNVSCTVKQLPQRLWEKAAHTARRINPINPPAANLTLDPNGILPPAMISVLTQKYWGPSPRTLAVSFMETAPADLQARILSHMNAWAQTCGISFALTNGVGNVRITRSGGGYKSYLGTDITLVPASVPTMHLQGFTMGFPESEFRRVVRHEAGHTLGFPHEHMRKELVARIDPAKAYPYFKATQGWEPWQVDQQVLTPLDQMSIYSTPPDQTSIMCYQLPGQITFDGQPILGGTDINSWDAQFAGHIYPRNVQPFGGGGAAQGAAAAPGACPTATDDWGPCQDVEPQLDD